MDYRLCKCNLTGGCSNCKPQTYIYEPLIEQCMCLDCQTKDSPKFPYHKEINIMIPDFTHLQLLPMPNPTPEELESPEFNAIWEVIKKWDINVPEYYNGYCGANGSHVKLILDALRCVKK